MTIRPIGVSEPPADAGAVLTVKVTCDQPLTISHMTIPSDTVADFVVEGAELDGRSLQVPLLREADGSLPMLHPDSTLTLRVHNVADGPRVFRAAIFGTIPPTPEELAQAEQRKAERESQRVALCNRLGFDADKMGECAVCPERGGAAVVVSATVGLAVVSSSTIYLCAEHFGNRHGPDPRYIAAAAYNLAHDRILDELEFGDEDDEDEDED